MVDLHSESGEACDVGVVAGDSRSVDERREEMKRILMK